MLDNALVVEWTEALAVPHGAMLPGDFGANVIKIEKMFRTNLPRNILAGPIHSVDRL